MNVFHSIEVADAQNPTSSASSSLCPCFHLPLSEGEVGRGYLFLAFPRAARDVRILSVREFPSRSFKARLSTPAAGRERLEKEVKTYAQVV